MVMEGNISAVTTVGSLRVKIS